MFMPFLRAILLTPGCVPWRRCTGDVVPARSSAIEIMYAYAAYGSDVFGHGEADGLRTGNIRDACTRTDPAKAESRIPAT